LILFFRRIDEKILEAFTTDDFLVIDTLFYERELSAELRLRLKNLSEKGIVEHTGHGKYILKQSLFEATGKQKTHNRLIGEERIKSKELLFEYIKQNGSKGTQLSELLLLLPRLSKDQVQNLLRDLKNEERVKPDGKANKARWYSI